MEIKVKNFIGKTVATFQTTDTFKDVYKELDMRYNSTYDMVNNTPKFKLTDKEDLIVKTMGKSTKGVIRKCVEKYNVVNLNY